MGKTLTAKRDELLDKAAAFEEAANHLWLTWTDDPAEWKAGTQVSKELQAKADKLRDRAAILTKQLTPTTS